MAQLSLRPPCPLHPIQKEKGSLVEAITLPKKAQPQRDTHYVHSHFLDENLVTWSHLFLKDARNCLVILARILERIDMGSIGPV